MKYNDYIPPYHPISGTADVISAAVGPSGTNSEYLFKLNEFLICNNLKDDYIEILSNDVRRRLGPWRNGRDQIRRIMDKIESEKENYYILKIHLI